MRINTGLVVTFIGAVARAIAQNTTNSTLPVHFGVVVFPAFQALDVFGPLDIFNMLAFQYNITLSVIASTLDPVSSKPRSMQLGSNFSQSIHSTHTFANPPKDLDVLIVPGGIGTRAPTPDLDDAIAYIKDVYPSLDYLLSVCTGAALVAQSGVLDGRNATTNKRSYEWVTSLGPNVNWVPHARWVRDGNIWSTSGVAAGIDGTFAFVASLWGEDVANATANQIEYERHTDPNWDPFADLYDL
ncbi:class I glutamine amidotransferase-like protein [Peniophora sp. CONT]|nr:class I glutamine amidotransferase-like protein [Peniophora sp. CONT]